MTVDLVGANGIDPYDNHCHSLIDSTYLYFFGTMPLDIVKKIIDIFIIFGQKMFRQTD